MTWRNTLLLAVAVAAVAGFAYWDLVKEQPDAGWKTVFEEPLPTPEYADLVPLVRFDPKSVEAIWLYSEEREAQTRRTAYGWTGTSKPRKLDDFLENLRELAVILSVDEQVDDDDLAGYGLAPPRARVRLHLGNEEVIEIAFGHHNPSTTGIYAWVSQRPGIALTGAVAMWDLGEALDALQGVSSPAD